MAGRVLVKLEEIARIIIGRIGFLCGGQVGRQPNVQCAFLAELSLGLQCGPNGAGDPAAFGVSWTDHQRGFVFAVAFFLRRRPQVRRGQRLIALAVRHFLNPAKPIQLGKPLHRPAGIEGLRRPFIVS